MLNIGSLILGVCAWLFGGLAIGTPKASPAHRNTVVSFGLCTIIYVWTPIELKADVVDLLDSIGYWKD